MNADERWFPGHLRDLDESECWEMLRSREVGRIAYVDERGPMVVPITFASEEEAVLFRVAPYSQIAQHLPHARVALEVDDIDYFTQSGWSVVLRGTAEIVESDELPPSQDVPTPWPDGRRNLYLRLRPDVVTGRRLLEA